MICFDRTASSNGYLAIRSQVPVTGSLPVSRYPFYERKHTSWCPLTATCQGRTALADHTIRASSVDLDPCLSTSLTTRVRNEHTGT